MSEVCVCGHLRMLHVGNGVTESACKGLRLGSMGMGGCACVGFTTEPRCDFCSAIPAQWTYPTHESAAKLEVQGGPEDGLHVGPAIVSNEGWAACETCHGLIEADDRDALADRLPVDHLSPSMRVLVRDNVQQMQRIQFWNQRYGAGYRH